MFLRLVERVRSDIVSRSRRQLLVIAVFSSGKSPTEAENQLCRQPTYLRWARISQRGYERKPRHRTRPDRYELKVDLRKKKKERKEQYRRSVARGSTSSRSTSAGKRLVLCSTMTPRLQTLCKTALP